MISACVITKNEEKHLPDWIASMQRIADELVVVDTGSTDATVKLAEAAGARVFFFQWIDDFAAAKNYALDQAKGDWILFCDADETFLPADAEQVKAAIAGAEPDVMGFSCPLRNIESDGSLQSLSVNLRVFRNHRGLRFQGAVHEILGWTGEAQGEIRYTEAFTIQHTGYTRENSRAKFERNLRLLEKVQAEGKARPVDIYHLAESYYGLQRYREALYYIEKFFSLDVDIVGDRERPLSLKIQSMICLGYPVEEIHRELREAEQMYPAAPVLAWIRGTYDYERGAWEGAQMALLRCVELAKAREPNPIEGRMSCVYSRLGSIREKKGDVEGAASWWEKALSANDHNGDALRGLLSLLAAAEDAELIGYLSSRYDAKRDASFILAALPEGREKVELYYRLKGAIPTPPWTLYRLAGKLGAASAALFEEQTALSRVLAAAGSEAERGELPAVYQAALRQPRTPAEYRVRRSLRVFFEEYKASQQEGKP